MGNISHRVATHSCCGGGKPITEQRDIEREISESMITTKTNKTHKQKDTKLESIPEEIKLEESEMDRKNVSFDFTQWIKANELDEIKHIFIKYKMTTISSLSNQTNLYRNFISDTELTFDYSYLMEKAVNSIDELNVKYNTNNEIDLNVIRQKSLELCSEDFSKFVNKKLNKIIDTLWNGKLDPNNKGYIESIDDIAEGIGFVAVVYKKHLHKKRKEQSKSFNVELEQQQIKQQAKAIATWVCYSYGEVDRYRLTKREFQHHLPEWIHCYANAKGAT